MENKKILDFLRDLRDHTSEGISYLETLFNPEELNAEDCQGVDSEVQDNCEEIEDSGNRENCEEEGNPGECDDSGSSDECDETPRTTPLPAEFSDHLGDSLKALEGYRLGRKPLAEEWNEAFSLLFAIVGDAARGVITPATAETLLRAASFSRETTAARLEGEIAGRNARIEEQLRSQPAGDGLPSLQGSRGAVKSSRRTESIFDLAGQAR